MSESPTKPGSSPDRFNSFVTFFKRYLRLWSTATAALPIPAAAFRLIPSYKAQRGFLAVYVSLFCFLVLGFIFYSRHTIARWMFLNLRSQERWARRFMAVLPLLFILGAVAFAAGYHALLQTSIDHVAYNFRVQGRDADATAVLDSATYDEIWGGVGLLLCYLGVFICAEAAFVLMAIREYMQDVLRISDLDMLEIPAHAKSPAS